MTQRKPLIKQPSLRRRQVAINLLENGGNASKAVRDAGYSATMAKNPQKITNTDSFRLLLEKMGVSDSLLVNALKDGLQATNEKGADFAVRHKYLETGLKLKGLAKSENNTNIQFNSYAQEQRNNYELS